MKEGNKIEALGRNTIEKKKIKEKTEGHEVGVEESQSSFNSQDLVVDSPL